MKNAIRIKGLHTQPSEKVNLSTESFSGFNTLTTEGFVAKVKGMFSKDELGKLRNENTKIKVKLNVISNTILNKKWLDEKVLVEGTLSLNDISPLTTSNTSGCLISLVGNSFKEHTEAVNRYLSEVEEFKTFIHSRWGDIANEAKSLVSNGLDSDGIDTYITSLDKLAKDIKEYNLNSCFKKPGHFLGNKVVSFNNDGLVERTVERNEDVKLLGKDGLVKIASFLIDNIDNILYLDDMALNATHDIIDLADIDESLLNQVPDHEVYNYTISYNKDGWAYDTFPKTILSKGDGIVDIYISKFIDVLLEHLVTEHKTEG